MATDNELTFGVWDARPEDYEAWLRLWESSPMPLVFSHPGYAQLFSDSQGAVAYCAYMISSVGCILYAFMMRDLTGEPCWNSELSPASDTITPYGYGGPLAWGPGTATITGLFSHKLWQWFRDHHVVTEFVRGAVVGDLLDDYPLTWQRRQPTVVRSLALDEEALWQDVDSKVRRNVKHARESGVSVEIDETGRRAADFRRIYYGTMTRRGAGRGYFFGESFFEQLHANLKGKFAYIHAFYKGEIISSDLVLYAGPTGYYYLGGTNAELFELRPNDLLKYEMILWARRAGLQQLVLGGGLTSDKNDGLFRYKKGFAPSGVRPFYTGSRILDPDAYRMLVQKHWTNNPALASDSDFFPAYRQPK